MAPDRPAALVTGSASGIGRAAALRLARAGYDVAINYSRSEAAARQALAELDRLGGRHLALRADVSDDAAVAALTAEVGETFGRLDALVNNAGIPARPRRTTWTGSTWPNGTGYSPSTSAGCSRSRGPAHRCCGRRAAAW
jgi:NAD(P)-dependent dehydrogenase (short-subunit alcohol dehydrogenase family)